MNTKITPPEIINSKASAPIKKTKSLSIITINFNNCCGLRKTIESVVAQTTRDFEYIIIDGGSTDGSVDVIKAYADYIDYWVSEPDKGIYNAMNKGVAVAHGDFCQFLNSGDTLIDENVTSKIINQLYYGIDILIGYTTAINRIGERNRIISGNPKHLSYLSILKRSLSHPSSFIKRELLLEFPYDENLRIVADWKFYLEAYQAKAIFRHTDTDVALFDMTGISSSRPDILAEERKKVFQEIDTLLLFSELKAIPNDLIIHYNRIENSYSLKRILTKLESVIITLYGCLKPKAIRKYSKSNSAQLLKPSNNG